MICRTLGLGLILAAPAAVFACGGTSVSLDTGARPTDPAPTEVASPAKPATPPVDETPPPPPPPPAATDGGTDASQPAKPKPGPVSFGMCAAATPCDASPVGTWEFSEGCIEDLIAPVREQCAGIRLDASTGTIAGTAIFTDTDVERSLAYLADATVFVPRGCTQGFSCKLIGPAIPMSIPGATGKCKDAAVGDGCDCSIHVDKEEKTGKVAYTRAGGQVTTANGDTFSICAEANVLTLTAETQQQIPGGVSKFIKR